MCSEDPGPVFQEAEIRRRERIQREVEGKTEREREQIMFFNDIKLRNKSFLLLRLLLLVVAKRLKPSTAVWFLLSVPQCGDTGHRIYSTGHTGCTSTSNLQY